MIKLPSKCFFSVRISLGKWKLSGIYNRRNLIQENYNTGSEGAKSQIRDGSRDNLEIDNRKSPPLLNEDTQGSTTFLCSEYKHCYRGKKRGK